MKEIEEQRYGRNKDTTINHSYINGGSYRKKFDKISDNRELNKMIYNLAKNMLVHRSGTLYEDMYWISVSTVDVVAQEIDSISEKEIIYSKNTKSIIKSYNDLITIHSHPNSFPPSISDLHSNYLHNYILGIIICHDGRIYLYNANEIVSKEYYNLTVAEYISNGYNEDRAQIYTLNELKDKFDIQFKEVR